MSGMDERARQFKTVAETLPTGPALRKEISVLRRFFFRNQEYRFTKAAQQALYMAIIAHHGNAAAHHASCYAIAATSGQGSSATTTAGATAGPSGASASGAKAGATVKADSDGEEDDGDAADAPVLRLLDDALKMPFTVFSSSQKEKLLGLYWGVLGTRGGGGSGGGGGGAAAAAAATQTLSLVDLVEVNKKKVQLALIADDGEDYAQEVLVTDADTIKRLKVEFDKGSAVSVTVQETDTGATFVSFNVEDE